MTSKTFKGFASDRELTVKGYDDGSQVDLLVRRSATGFGVTGIAIAPSDAPALCLAILEAAGGSPLGEARWVTDAKYALGEIATFRATKEAEARERAELEAEALELFNTQVRALGDGLEADSLDDMHHIAKESWLAVARRAREMRTEK